MVRTPQIRKKESVNVFEEQNPHSLSTAHNMSFAITCLDSSVIVGAWVVATIPTTILMRDTGCRQTQYPS